MDFSNELDDASSSAAIVRIERANFESGHIDAYVLARKGDLVLLLVIDDKIDFDGFYVIRLSDISKLEHPAPTWKFQEQALKSKDQEVDESPEIDLSDFASVIRTAGVLFPCVTIHIEDDDPEVCYIGKVIEVTENSISLQEITPNAEWEDEVEIYDPRKLTRVDFGGKYEATLMLVGGEPHNPVAT